MYVVLLTYLKPWFEVMALAPEQRAYAATRYADGSYLMSSRVRQLTTPCRQNFQ